MHIQRPTFQRPEPPAPNGAPTRLAITLGDPNGIGPEVVLKSLHDPSLMPSMTPVLIGSAHVLRVHADVLGFSDLDIHIVDEVPEEVPHGDVAVLDVAEDPEPPVMFGSITAEGGRLAMRAVERAVEACQADTVDAMVTAPISKDAVRQGGYDVPGHTEFLADKTNSPQPTMMMVAGGLRVGLVTSHTALSEVPSAVTEEAILEKLRVIDASLRDDFAIEQPKIAVFGLNPHAGEAGAFGQEEEEVIAPALRAARQEGFRVEGPMAADGFFGTQLDADHDAALAMYHDQGLVPFKALAFDHGVNYTAGLPIVRTSPDHGTAYGIAGKGMALPGSMRNAMELAVAIARHRHQQATPAT
ncbi:4-hydroxythreonine-4-phosphate dehydrogenase PdxA [Salinibacter ruber]|uniref:4-hydroxythreonine-4-phosphate dehydrogenase n=1 Tax=Salinibacter ruber TaxID=146919 RepID=A0A9X2TCQ5_9BACT|nr:4-hydroxythreonine-4-phosphate dehydrogenase PdxA [Salinibacter ruber]MCS3647408.1 4-hydroxythreonine-4-phosphate dehydrogenase [Salinibacter ruber]MCS3678643.1 4-hydroxythreonine-4-phosphate dehydrogenase [Salinibacter ruber]MCS3681824.1 4-hydroxythreonine-4-phosphate dehydrogenase [Salinibacter ruber]